MVELEGNSLKPFGLNKKFIISLTYFFLNVFFCFITLISIVFSNFILNCNDRIELVSERHDV